MKTYSINNTRCIALIVPLLTFLSCKQIKDVEIAGCYQAPLKGDVGGFYIENGKYTKFHSLCVVHSDHTYSDFISKKNNCDTYIHDENHYPISGVWHNRGRYLYFKSYLQDSSKAWYKGRHDNGIKCIDSIMICVHHFYTQVQDSGCKTLRVFKIGNDSLYDTYYGKDGVFYIKRKTKNIDVDRSGCFTIDGFRRYMSMDISQIDTYTNRIDVYLLPFDRIETSKYMFKSDYLEKRTFYWHGIIPKIVSFKMYKVM